MNSIDEDIRTGNYSRVYLLTGEEAYLRLSYKNRLKEKLCRAGDNLNVATFTGKHVPVGEVIDFANTLPFMAEKRVVFLEDTSLFEAADESLVSFIPEVPEDTCMIFVQEKADRRGRLYKAIQKHGRVVNLERPADEVLERWILGRIKSSGLNIRRSAMEAFMLQVNADMQTMSEELEKLICYCLDSGEITQEDVRAVCTVRAEDRVFDMIEDIVRKDRRGALLRYYDLLTLKEPPVKILSLIGRQFSQLLTVKVLKKEGLSADDIVKRTSLHPYAVKKCLSNSAGYSVQELTEILEGCAGYENDVKQGRLEAVMSVELLIAKLTG